MNVLITGASGDIGLAIAKAFSGHRLILQYHSANKDFAAAFPGAMAICCDLRSSEQTEAMFRHVETQCGPVEVLINNCGISEFSLFQDISDKQWENMISTNLSSAFYACRCAIPQMLRRGKGSIVNIASVWGQTGASCEVHYSASKGGLIAMTKALAKELAPSAIRVNCVSPGFIEGKMNSHLSPEEKAEFINEIPMGRGGDPMEVAAAVRFLALEGSYISGQVLGVNGGML